MNRPLLAALTLVLSAGLPLAAMAQDAKSVQPATAAPTSALPAAHKPQVQLAILLDTSGSMDGLIEQAKTQIWGIVNDLATAKQRAERPALTVALYEYGKSTIPASEGYLRQILPLTDDLDEVSNQLFALTTNGGEEYCGQVIEAATKGLSWSTDPADLRIIVIAGNEPFSQGTVDYHKTVPEAAKKGIIVNTIFCGNRQEGVQTGWEDGARLGEGQYGFIDQGATVPHIDAPQDGDIARLSGELNLTYIPFGAEGDRAAARQEAQDKNAAGASPEAQVARAQTKSSYLYSNAGWDLVDAVKEKKVKLEEVAAKDLPQNMQQMSPAQREAYVKQQLESRASLQQQIQGLTAARDEFVAKKRKEQAGQPSTLAAALIATIRKQAQDHGFTYDAKGGESGK